jgi:membrane protease YdiL (CAAX protease family)
VVWLTLISVYTLISAAAGFQKFHLQHQRQDFINLIIVSLLLLSVKAVFEETFFRGYLMQGFSKLFLNRWMPVMVTALLFTILQYFYPETKVFGLRTMFPQHFLFGIFLGICTVMDDGLELALGINFINTIFFAIFFTEQSNAMQTPALFNITDNNTLAELSGLLLVCILFLLVAKKSFSWPDWNYLVSKITAPDMTEEAAGFEDYGLLDEYEGED